MVCETYETHGNFLFIKPQAMPSVTRVVVQRTTVSDVCSVVAQPLVGCTWVTACIACG